MIIPFSAEISGLKQPYVTYAIIILCILIHMTQDHNRGKIDQALITYCSSIFDPSLDEDTLDALRLDEDVCYGVLGDIHSMPNMEAFTTLLEKPVDESGEEWSEENFSRAVAYLEQHYENIKLMAPARLDAKLSYEPSSLNPITSLFSALAHADWWHVIGNLIFFFAFSAALELLVGNSLKYIGILILIEYICDLTYSFTSLVNGSDIATLGLSGIVMGVIGLSAYMMPWARIRTFVWILFHMRIYYIPAWMLAGWFIGWDTFYLLTTTDNSGVNLVAHVSGGIAGYMIGFCWLGSRKDEIQDELNDEINYRKCLRADKFGMMSSYNGGNHFVEENRQRHAENAYAAYKDRLHHLIQVRRDSEAIVLIIDDYDLYCQSTDIYEELFYEVHQWRKGRAMLCLGRLTINLLIDNKRYASALSISEACLDLSDNFVLADSSQLLHLTKIAIEMHQYILAYRLISNAGERYGSAIDVFRCRLFEVELLWQHLQKPEEAKRLISELLGDSTNSYPQETLALANLMR